jgi:hypothetical protein
MVAMLSWRQGIPSVEVKRYESLFRWGRLVISPEQGRSGSYRVLRNIHWGRTDQISVDRRS